MRARAVARANIALAKYWGKCDAALNLPAVPSVSLTLDALVTETVIELDGGLDHDVVTLDGSVRDGSEAKKVVAALDRVRRAAGRSERARVTSENRFPTASGLASSASGFAALAAASARAYGLGWSEREVSAEARRGSASAARSVYGGWVELPAGVPGDDRLAAAPLHGPEHWEVALVVAMATKAAKAIASRDGMKQTAETSPYWSAWLGCAPLYAKAVKDALAARDLEAVGTAMEASTFAMHASAWAAVPAVRYARGVTLELLDRVRALRHEGVEAWATMDAGPHVKVLCMAADAERVREAVAEVQGVVDTLIARPGAGVEVSEG